MRVELDIFSGRPNPVWELTGVAAEQVAHRLRGLPPVDQPAEPLALGYRGFLVHNPERGYGLPALLRVYQGITDLSDPEQPLFFADRDDVEALLRGQAGEQGFTSLLD